MYHGSTVDLKDEGFGDRTWIVITCPTIVKNLNSGVCHIQISHVHCSAKTQELTAARTANRAQCTQPSIHYFCTIKSVSALQASVIRMRLSAQLFPCFADAERTLCSCIDKISAHGQLLTELPLLTSHISYYPKHFIRHCITHYINFGIHRGNM